MTQTGSSIQCLFKAVKNLSRLFFYNPLNISIDRLGCGIPSVTLKGTVNDWQSVLDRTRQLQELGAGNWTDELIPVLEQFVQTAKGNPD